MTRAPAAFQPTRAQRGPARLRYNVRSLRCARRGAGHPGEEDVGGLVLFPAAAQALSIPIVASGGIADGRGLAAALALGCDGINMGTRFLATKEAPAHDNIKQAIVNMKETDTSLLFRKFRNTARVFKNDIAVKVQEIENAGGEFGDIHQYVSGKNQEIAWTTGDVNAGMVTWGMCGGLIKEIPTCEEVVTSIANEAKAIIREKLAAMAE